MEYKLNFKNNKNHNGTIIINLEKENSFYNIRYVNETPTTFSIKCLTPTIIIEDWEQQRTKCALALLEAIEKYAITEKENKETEKIKDENTIRREALQELICKARNEARAIENGYCRMHEAIKRIKEISDPKFFTDDSLPILIDDLGNAEDLGDVIDICDDMDEYIDDTIARGVNL